MSPSIKKIKESFAEVKPKDLVYPGIVLAFMIIVGVLFFSSSRFITKNINDAFSGDTGSEASTLNMTNYTLVAKKLGISIEQQNNTTTIIPTATTEDTVDSTVQPSQVVDKKSLTINILNSTTRSGVATKLSKALESAGFAKATTGNEKKLYPITTIITEESNASFGRAILEEVRKIYPNAVTSTTTEDVAFDAIVIIGSK